MTAPALVQNLWNYPDLIGACCNPAVAGRENGLSHGDSIEMRATGAFSSLLFDSRFHRSGCAQTCGLPLSTSLRLKLADEESRPPYNSINAFIAS